MRIILGSDAIHRPLTGIGRYALELARQLRGMPGIDQLDFFAFGRWQAWEDLLAVDAPAPGEPGPPREQARPPKTLRSVLAASPPVVRAYAALTPAFYAWRLRGRSDALFHAPNYFLPRHPGPTVATIHDLSHVRHPEFHPKARVDFLNRSLPVTLKRADFLITDAESVRQEVITHFGWPAERIAAVALGVDPMFRPREATEAAATLQRHRLQFRGYTLFVGTVEPRKNLGLLLHCYARLAEAERRRWPLVIAGSRGWHAEDIHARMRAAEAQGWLRYLEFVPQGDLPGLYAGARLFVYPSLYEGFGLPPLEAMASGVPVVCTNVASLPEVVGDAALQVAPSDERGLWEALSLALEDERWRANATAAGLRRASELTWARCAERTAAVYERVITRLGG